jgi:hypothetical protein
MQRELSYQIPFKRLRKVGRLVCRKAFPTMQLVWLLLALYFAAIIGLVVVGNTLDAWLSSVGVRYGVELLFVSLVLLALAGIWGLRRLMEWSGRAPAPPAISWSGAPRQGARHVSDTQDFGRRDRR